MTDITELTAKLRHWASMASVTSERDSCLSVEQLTEVAEALEAAEKRISGLESSIKAANERYENRTPTEWAYGQACAAIENHRARADAAEARIAELEARTLTVKLPVFRDTYKEAFASEVEHHVRIELGKLAAAAGIKLQIEGE